MYLFKYRHQLKLEPLSVAALLGISAAASAASSGISAIGAGKMNRRGERYATAENERNRVFQAEQAQLGREWQEDFYNKYQSPSAQIKMYKDAGLNPALMYEGGYSPGSTPSGASPVGGSSMMPTFTNPLDNFDMLGPVMDAFRLKNEITALDSENKVRDATVGKINSEALLNGETLELTKANVSKVNKEIEKIGKDMDLTDEQINKIKKEVINIGYDNELKSYTISVNSKYKTLSENLDLPIPVTEELVNSLVRSAGDIIGGALGGALNKLLGIFTKNKSSNQPSLRMQSDGRGAFAPGSTVVWQ